MDKNKVKKYVNISGFHIESNNRGNAALSYGTVSFLKKIGELQSGQEFVKFRFFKNPFKRCNRHVTTASVIIDEEKWIYHVVPVFEPTKYILLKFNVLVPFSKLKFYIRNTAYEAADYGGDGFSDIYGDKILYHRFRQTFLLWKRNIPLIILPQTIGPFEKKENYALAIKILKYASRVYVRDSRFNAELEKEGIEFQQEKDLSAYMLPKPWDVEIKNNPVGLNVSGLAYSNRFPNLEGQFDAYPDLIMKLIELFRNKGCSVYLIPHSYNYSHPETNNDDLVACREVYSSLRDKSNVVLIDRDMISPEVKYLISKMKFFVGTRMHANFAAIFTNTPVFGLSYSYKFQGAFEANGLYNQTATINYLKVSEIDTIIDKVNTVYKQYVNTTKNGKDE